MQLIQYLISVAKRHTEAKQKHEEEIREQIWEVKTNNRSCKKPTISYADEEDMVKDLIDTIQGKPKCLSKTTPPEIVTFAYIIKAKMANDHWIRGYEIIEKLVRDPEKTVIYLTALEKLEQQEWIRLLTIYGSGFTDQPPFCWLQSQIELGDAFHREMNNSEKVSASFSSNDAYLDAVFSYLNEVIADSGDRYKTNETIDPATVQPEGWLRMIVQRAQASKCRLPAADVPNIFRLSTYQYLVLVGMLGVKNKDLIFDFNDTREITCLFASGRVARKRMNEHLFGTTSKLFRYRLIEATQSQFGETVQLTTVGIKALIGNEKNSSQELKMRISKNTLFDFEEPKVKKDSLMLTPQTTEVIQSLIFSESKQGKRIRKSWHDSLPSAWGSPTGTTLILYGPPGTGKTLTAQYLASEMKLPLLKIDASKILGCWVGESEQNVRRIFDDYKTLQNEMNKSPVLLLNEADQLLGSRGSGGNSIDRMNNNMQNLFLEGMERFSGIMIATTNRRDLLDEAFSRRFTYKLELPPPDKNLRKALWKSHLPMERLADDVAIEQLADLELTGGEIRLVVERTVRLLAYRGIKTIDSVTLMDVAKEEFVCRMKQSGNMNRIGF